ncbi:MAG: cell envelope integrity protein TolA [Oscillatoriales cyanobacterium C42_A2020_001]|nr:cell envelope integrity protein TolA [Leptolyngbyaceae cyanobacterium C42_A2020_001]
MKALSSSPWITLMLKLVGAILILTSLIDYITLFTTVDFQNKQTIITFTTGVVDRGFIPLVGIILTGLGVWFESGDVSTSNQASPMLRLVVFVVASILGLLFLLIVPWHVLTVRDAAATEVTELGKRADTLKAQVETQVKQLKAQGPQQLDAQLAQIEQALNSGSLSGTQLTQTQQERERLRQLKSDPKALEATMEAQIAPKRTEEITRIDSDAKKAKELTETNAMRSALRTGLNSLLLAIGYIILGWTGLRQMLSGR